MYRICPLMSRPGSYPTTLDGELVGTIECQKEKCQLWVKEYIEKSLEKDGERLYICHCGLVRR